MHTDGELRVVGFGDNVVDRFVDRGILYPGGNCVNFAVYAQRLGLDSAYVGVLGNDVAASHIRAALEDLSVDTSHCAERHGPTGWCDVVVTNGDRVFGEWSGGVVLDQPFVPNDDDLDYLSQFDLVHLGAYGGVEPWLPALRERCRLISFDLSDEIEQRQPAYLERTLKYVDLAVVSATDLEWDEAEAFAETMHSHGASLSIVTRGLHGSGVFDGKGFHRADAIMLDALDTMGAGDAFITAFITELLRAGWSANDVPPSEVLLGALHKAAQFAALQCTVQGAFGYPLEFVR